MCIRDRAKDPQKCAEVGRAARAKVARQHDIRQNARLLLREFE